MESLRIIVKYSRLFRGLFQCPHVGGGFQSWIRSVNAEMESISSRLAMTRHMGCTLSGLIWQKNGVWVVNAGDSRTYRFRNGELLQLTEDHNFRRRSGYDFGPDRSKLVNCIGAGASAEVDIRDISGDVQSGDVFLVCTDGLYEMLSEQDIFNVFTENFDSAISVARLTRTAESAGGRDNISLIVVKVV